MQNEGFISKSEIFSKKHLLILSIQRIQDRCKMALEPGPRSEGNGSVRWYVT